MSILGNDVANSIQSDYRAHAAQERHARSMRIQPTTTFRNARPSLVQRLQLLRPNWARLLLVGARVVH
jgi:hypothetical protein